MINFDLKEIIDIPYGSPDFLEKVFVKISETSEGTLESILDLKNELVLSFLCELSQLQDSFRFRCRRRSQILAEYLINDEGELQRNELSGLIELMEKCGYINYPQGLGDGIIVRHQLSVLRRLRDEESLYKLIKKFQRPLCHRNAEKFVRQALGIMDSSVIVDTDIKRAVLAACLTVLRQNIGSCFATAPAILIHEEKIEYFLNDLYELLMTGKLRRTFGGKEHSVPLSPNSGVGDLKKSIFLPDPHVKIWLSPGLIRALETAGMVDAQMSLDQKIAAVKNLTTPFLENSTDMSVEQLIHQILLAHFQLTDVEMLKFQRMEKEMVLRNRQISSAGQSSNSSQKLQEYYRMQERESLAKEAFKGFADNALLKVWEFSLASFSEIKMEFSRWNLYSSLGLDPKEKNGIGEAIFEIYRKKN